MEEIWSFLESETRRSVDEKVYNAIWLDVQGPNKRPQTHLELRHMSHVLGLAPIVRAFCRRPPSRSIVLSGRCADVWIRL